MRSTKDHHVAPHQKDTQKAIGHLEPNGYGCAFAGYYCCCSSWQRARHATQALRHLAALCSDTTSSVCITKWHMPGARLFLFPRVGREQRWDENGSGRTPEGVLAHRHKNPLCGRKSLSTRKPPHARKNTLRGAGGSAAGTKTIGLIDPKWLRMCCCGRLLLLQQLAAGKARNAGSAAFSRFVLRHN